MSRRRPGVAGLKRHDAAKKAFTETGAVLAGEQLEQMAKQLTTFRSALETFAAKHKNEINKNPAFRAQFQRMCTQCGVDPLASTKGFWGQVLGVGDFYYELAVQLIDICLMTRAHNGGLISLEELLARLRQRRGRQAQAISDDDVSRALKKVSCLGNGFQVLTMGSRSMVVSVPCELNRDHMSVLELAARDDHGHVTSESLTRALAWPRHRVDQVLHLMLQEGMAWIDSQATPATETHYWFPSLFDKHEPEASVAGISSSSSSSSSGAGTEERKAYSE